MADTVRRVQYFYIEVSDKPGEGIKLLVMLHGAGASLLAFSGFPQGRRAQVDLIPADPVVLRAAARQAKFTLGGPKTVFLIQGEDRVGALTEMMGKLYHRRGL